MAYGFKILSTDGYVDIANMKTCQLITKQTRTAASGSFTVPDFNSTKGFVYKRVAVNSTVFASFVTQDWNNSTKVFSWSGNAYNDSITWFFFMTEL